MIGQTIDDRYQIEALLGRGGMGVVYRATDRIEKRPVALKILHLYLDGESEVALTRFNREFRILAQLDHPRIVQAYEYGSHDGAPYLVLELLEGYTLTKELTNGPLSRSRLLLIARQICEALVYLHARSIVHRDLKPSNVMLLPGDDVAEVKLMDFGLVRQGNLSVQLTQEGVALGTVAYMAPEQAQGFPVDFRADLYALGIILYEMATGRPPFVHENPAVVLMQQLTAVPLAPRQINSNLDERLETLILELLAKEPSQRPNSSELLATRLAHLADGSAPVPGPVPKRTDLIPRVPLIGRAAVLSELTQHWTKVQLDEGSAKRIGVVLLSGVAGAGKTRLISEVSLQVRLGNGCFLTSNCREYTALPYQPLIDVVDKLLHNLPAAVREGVPLELARLLPNTSANVPGDTDLTDQTEARLRLFTACWEIMRQAAQNQALMIAIEDVQWADPATLELLGYLIRQIEQAPILLVLTYRPEEVEPGAALATLQRDLRRNQAVRLINLGLLTREQVAKFLQVALGQKQVSGWLVDDFHLATGGNPLFIEETLKALATEGQITAWANQSAIQSIRLSSMALQLPQNVLALAERRLQQLSDDDRPILTAASVLGPEFSFTLLEKVTRLDEDTLLDAIDRLLAARLIEELPLQAGEDRYRFAQEALRQALLNTISQRRLRRLHLRTGEAIEVLYDIGQPRYWPVLAYHFGMASDTPRAFKYCILVGDIAAGMYANVEAIMHYNQALKMIDDAGADEPLSATSQLIHLYTRRGQAMELNTQYEEALANYEEMHELGQTRKDQPLVLAALGAITSLRASFVSPLKDFAQAESLAKEALALAHELEDREAEADILRNMMLLYLSTDRAREAVAYGEQSLAIARELDLREQMAYTLSDLQFGYLNIGQREGAEEGLQEAQEIWRELDNKPMLVDNLSRFNFADYLRGDYEQVLKRSEEGYQISRSIDYLWGQGFSRIVSNYIFLDYGQPDKAIAVLEDNIRLGQQVGLVFPVVSARVDLGWVYGILGAIEAGLELVQSARTQLEQEKDLLHGVRAWPFINLARLHLLNNDLAAAELALEEAYNELNMESLASFGPFVVVLAEGELALAMQDYPQVVALIDELVVRIHQAEVYTFLPEALYLKGKALLAQGQGAKAGTALTEARTAAQELGSRRTLWPILFALSQLETDPDKAARLGHEAREIVEYIADNAGSDELRASFLGLPEVQQVVTVSSVS
jgi:predicted ATPase